MAFEYRLPGGEQGWRSGESTRLSPMWPGFDSRTRLHICVELRLSFVLDPSERVFFGVIRGLSLLVFLVLSPRGFSPGTPFFPSPIFDLESVSNRDLAMLFILFALKFSFYDFIFNAN